MEIVLVVLGVGVVVLGGLAVWLGLRLGRVNGELSSVRANEAAQRDAGERQAAELRSELAQARALADSSTQRVTQQAEELARLHERLENAAAVQQELSKNEARLKEAFGALSAQALRDGRAEFLAQAKPVFEAARKEQSDLVKPIGEVLSATKEKLEAIEKQRLESFSKLGEQIELTATASKELRGDYNELIRALSQPTVRGRYGELQLKRVAELAGMTAYCDFDEQSHTVAADGRALRPDMVVRLPNNRSVAVDAKCNTYAYVEAAGSTDPGEQKEHLDRFAGHVADQVMKLSRKGYWAEFDGSPDFVVMFVPGDQFLDAALARKPDLLERAAERDVILASPSTLIGLLRAVAVGWREHALTERAQELFELGKQLHDRASVAFGYAGDLGKSLRQSVEKYNKLIGSIDSRLMPTLRKFEEAGAKSAKELVDLDQVEAQPKLMESGNVD